ncbi:cation:proton antiporter [Mangrovimicrobium sediminis]|uniref:Cation:proton antiporter n=1 Tax=Mangrovimicrobium sediminis TaxID=2562682 RepID=A0A4Z0LV44_9GAMM|nr:cation:proton antiporter [Haliea sp. SAOS-164]TGD71192.1 cation:proton antiporter [Haliea sp. SAOS-164]
MHDLSILAIIWVNVFIASFMAHRTRLTPVLWYLFCGAAMVNLGLLPEAMPVFIVDFAELGIIVIMFALGFEEDNRNFLRSLKRSWGIALFGAVVPFAVAYGLARWAWDDHNMALLCGLAMTATAVSLTMVSLKSEGLSRTPAATGIMTSAVLDDIGSLALVAILIPVATGEASITLASIAVIAGKAALFFIIVTFFGAWLFPASEGFAKRIPLLGHLNLRRILAMGEGEYTVLALLLIAVAMGLLGHEFGFHPAVGAYMAGLIINREYFSFHSHRQVDFHERAKQIVDNVAFTWIGPVFFVSLGTELIFDAELALQVLPYALLLFAGLFVGQIASAALAARYTGGFDWPASLMIGFGMLGRAELAFLVMDIAYVQYSIMSAQAFYTLMLATFLLNTSVPLTIRWWKSRYGGTAIGST